MVRLQLEDRHAYNKDYENKLIWRPIWIPMTVYSCCQNREELDNWKVDAMMGRVKIAPKSLTRIRKIFNWLKNV